MLRTGSSGDSWTYRRKRVCAGKNPFYRTVKPREPTVQCASELNASTLNDVNKISWWTLPVQSYCMNILTHPKLQHPRRNCCWPVELPRSVTSTRLADTWKNGRLDLLISVFQDRLSKLQNMTLKSRIIFHEQKKVSKAPKKACAYCVYGVWKLPVIPHPSSPGFSSLNVLQEKWEKQLTNQMKSKQQTIGQSCTHNQLTNCRRRSSKT